MEEKVTLVETLYEKAEIYAKTNIELFKLKAIDKSAEVVSSIASSMVFVILASRISLLINIGLALWIGELVGKIYYGFFIVAFFYVIVMFILYVFRQQAIKTPVNDSLIIQMLKEKDK